MFRNNKLHFKDSVNPFIAKLIKNFVGLNVKTVVAQVDFTHHLPALARTGLETRKKSLILASLGN